MLCISNMCVKQAVGKMSVSAAIRDRHDIFFSMTEVSVKLKPSVGSVGHFSTPAYPAKRSSSVWLNTIWQRCVVITFLHLGLFL